MATIRYLWFCRSLSYAISLLAPHCLYQKLRELSLDRVHFGYRHRDARRIHYREQRYVLKPVGVSPVLSNAPASLLILYKPKRTVCTKDYGDCGCDNCKGDFEDISDRMDEFAERLWVEGWDRTKAVWTVPQAFGDETCVI